MQLYYSNILWLYNHVLFVCASLTPPPPLQILQQDGQEAQVKFVRQVGDHFIWPTVEDTSWMPLYALVAIEAPDLDAREHMFLTAEAKKMFNS